MSEPSFEKALAELEDIVNKMESGDLALKVSMDLFEKGVKLAKYLRAELAMAEKKIELLVKNEKGETQPESFDLSDKSDQAPDKNEPSDSEENNDLPF